jgi:hypothetical protein
MVVILKERDRGNPYIHVYEAVLAAVPDQRVKA